VEDLPFLLPLFTRRSRPLVGSGLWLYDLAAGFPKGLIHKHLNPEETWGHLPSLSKDELRGGFLYYDARADDCRLVMHVAKKANDLGAVLANDLEVTGFLKSRGRIRGVKTREFEIAAHRVVNATGVWCDRLRQIDNPSEPAAVRPSKGVHLVIPTERLKLASAVMLSSPSDGRIVFLIPWGSSTIVGTTDTDYSGAVDRPRAEGADVDYLLGLVNARLQGLRLGPEDITSTYAGLRPLLLDTARVPSTASREHHLFESESGLLSITGGKLTTYRLMAKEVVDRLTRVRSRTHAIDLYATPDRDPLSRLYGSESTLIGDRTPLLDGLPHVWGEVDYAIRREMARSVTDVLSRRVRVALFAPDQGRDLALPTAQRMARWLGWDRREVTRQVDGYFRELEEGYPRP
jgi:glycerol-3-phosphate dehydrogenase